MFRIYVCVCTYTDTINIWQQKYLFAGGQRTEISWIERRLTIYICIWRENIVRKERHQCCRKTSRVYYRASRGTAQSLQQQAPVIHFGRKLSFSFFHFHTNRLLALVLHLYSWNRTAGTFFLFEWATIPISFNYEIVGNILFFFTTRFSYLQIFYQLI